MVVAFHTHCVKLGEKVNETFVADEHHGDGLPFISRNVEKKFIFLLFYASHSVQR